MLVRPVGRASLAANAHRRRKRGACSYTLNRRSLPARCFLAYSWHSIDIRHARISYQSDGFVITKRSRRNQSLLRHVINPALSLIDGLLSERLSRSPRQPAKMSNENTNELENYSLITSVKYELPALINGRSSWSYRYLIDMNGSLI